MRGLSRSFVVEHQTVAPGTGLGEAEDAPDLLAEFMRPKAQEKHAASTSSGSSSSNTNT
ncbi:hypothetical protein HUA76_13980 [Myxococcus sp. CA056]|uniref:hypothetical protein n=1 Tax=Myxococcus sp. CA056 TaxID=2741740 RepID=UPI00157B3E61|nr:hypothetical protein [Myxococcus sp. CA056]NTX11904.1 hypothetical protein [Myxococcus sp. CA056]